MGKINDLDMKNRKSYEDIFSDSLWIIKERDKSGSHKGDYHGNFIPQIPYQMMMRYTKMNDWILDPFMGSGTTVIEAQKLNRNAIGIDINPYAVDLSSSRLNFNSSNSFELITADSSNIDLKPYLKKYKINNIQFVIYHPPYWDIIKFNDLKGNIANSATLNDFLKNFERVFDNTIKYLEINRYFCIVIGDIYKKGEWIPLNSHIIQLLLSKGYILKSTIVKNMGETAGKTNQKALWRYRSLANGYYVFAHEYILVFKKNK